MQGIGGSKITEQQKDDRKIRPGPTWRSLEKPGGTRGDGIACAVVGPQISRARSEKADRRSPSRKGPFLAAASLSFSIILRNRQAKGPIQPGENTTPTSRRSAPPHQAQTFCGVRWPAALTDGLMMRAAEIEPGRRGDENTAVPKAEWCRRWCHRAVVDP
ncbi:hypothetical protein VTI74DRAFT_607 [Chaetomium olivicolor]